MHTPTLTPSLEEKLSALPPLFQERLRSNERLMDLLKTLVERGPGSGWSVGFPDHPSSEPEGAAGGTPAAVLEWERRLRPAMSYVHPWRRDREGRLRLSFELTAYGVLQACVVWVVGADGVGTLWSHWHEGYGWLSCVQRAQEAKRDLIGLLEATNAPRRTPPPHARAPFRRGDHVQIVWDNGTLGPRAIVYEDEDEATHRVNLGLGWVHTRLVVHRPKSEK